MNQSSFAPTDIAITPVNETNVHVHLDLDFRFLGEYGTNSIPRAADDKGLFKYTVPVVHRDAIVQGYNRDITTNIT